MRRIVLITGANGFLGKNLAEYFHKQGCYIIGSVSSEEKISQLSEWIDEKIVYNINGVLKLENLGKSPDIVIFSAYDTKNPSLSIQHTIQVSKSIAVKYASKQVFISSVSVDTANRSEYGKVKRELEYHFYSIENSLIIRPGLILGHGGLYQNMLNYITNHTIIPLPDGGIYGMAVIPIDILCAEIFNLVKDEKSGIRNLYNSKLISLRDIVLEIAYKLNKKVFIFTIPIRLVELLNPIVNIILKILKLRINFDSIIGYKLYKTMVLPKSDLPG